MALAGTARTATADASPTRVERPSRDAFRPRLDREEGLRRVQRLLAIMRLPTIALGALFGPIVVAPDLQDDFWILIGATAVYAVLLLIASRLIPARGVWALGYLSILLDTAALSGAIALTGGIESNLHVAFYAIAISVSIYFRTFEAILFSLLYAAGYALAITFAGGPEVWADHYATFGFRMGFVILASAYVGLLSRERWLLSDVNVHLQQEIERRARADTMMQAVNSAMAAVQEADTDLSVYDRLSAELGRLDLGMIIAGDTGKPDRFGITYVSLPKEIQAQVARIAGRAPTEATVAWRDNPDLRELVRSGQARLFPSARVLIGSLEPVLTTNQSEEVIAAIGDPQLIVAPIFTDRVVTGLLTVLGRPLFPEDVNVVMAFSRQVSVGVRLLERLRELQRIERTKSEFLAMVSHELKTPLTAVKTATGLLTEVEVASGDAARGRLVRSIQRGVSNLERMTLELLDFARMQDAALNLDKQPIDFREVVDGVLTELNPLLREKNQTVQRHISPIIPIVTLDRNRISQVLGNLVGNANKYTPAGSTIVIMADVDGDDLVVRVQDDGPGIPPDEQKWIFDPFFRGAEGQRISLTGSGLGLAIARSLVELHGGKIWVQSAPGSGSTFGFSIPLGG